jgi:hypothetical protein
MTIASELLLAVLLKFPSTPARQCLIERRDRIELAITESIRRYPLISPEVLVAVGFSETHLGCDANEGGNWGAPMSATQRHIPGTPMQAAKILYRSYETCGSDWESAARRFRTGDCRPSKIGSRYAASVIRLSQQLVRITEQMRQYNTYACFWPRSVCY